MENQGRESEEANQALLVQLQPHASQHTVGALRFYPPQPHRIQTMPAWQFEAKQSSSWTPRINKISANPAFTAGY